MRLIAVLLALFLAPFAIGQMKINVDWKTSACLNLGMDIYQTLKFPSQGLHEENPVTRCLQHSLGYTPGTLCAGAVGVAAILVVGRRYRWAYAVATLIEATVVLLNRDHGSPGFPLVWFNLRF